MNKIKVAILCGGRGRRLKPLTDELPKPLIPLQNKPILEHIFNFFKTQGFSEFILCVGYKGHKIIEMVDDYKTNNQGSFVYSDLGENASILQRIYGLNDKCNDRLLVTYGDTLTDLAIDNLLREHTIKKTLMTIVASKIRNPFGLIEIGDDGLAVSFVEKPLSTYYIGHLVMEKKVFSLITEELLNEPDGKGLVLLFLKLIEMKTLNVFEHHGCQITFNTEVERINAEKEIIDFYSQKENV
ncbi:glucose-1-phosphate cytidylyltransferase [Candidatus Magnetobacterium bavaricum]|uniref:Glucose-1-phosphate cytidylyltransferase n=1 Tax=Candidatus Magnetobacterium bavaricum TaxID=29290 RepID=A0A0F3GH93_9BACT|nr:glucose-1-phosphate cytidylyltransferase [Candidatus Magnetobacterium bavaricum]